MMLVCGSWLSCFWFWTLRTVYKVKIRDLRLLTFSFPRFYRLYSCWVFFSVSLLFTGFKVTLHIVKLLLNEVLCLKRVPSIWLLSRQLKIGAPLLIFLEWDNLPRAHIPVKSRLSIVFTVLKSWRRYRFGRLYSCVQFHLLNIFLSSLLFYQLLVALLSIWHESLVRIVVLLTVYID
jgi:hypothetical protein